MRHIILSFVLGVALSFCAFGQKKAPDKLPAWLIQASAGYQTPGGDLAERFGDNFSVGVGVGYKTSANWIFSTDFQYMFGNNVKNEDQLLAPIMSPDGHIFNQTGNYADVAVLQRGLSGTFDISKTFDFLNANPNSGPSLLIGAGYLAHWLSVNDVDNNSPQVMGEYQKGYDELSGGLLLKQSIGYLYLARNRRVNFRLSFELMQAFTTNLRGFSYSTGKVMDEQKLDLLYGVKFQWFLPIYSEGSRDYFYD